MTITFTPHLVPLAQGELVSCYVTPAREHDADEVAALYDDAYAREPFVELRAGPPGVLEVRETNYCRISVHCDPRTGRILVFAAIDNLWKGAASQAVQNLNLMFGRDEREGPARERVLARAGSSRPRSVTERAGRRARRGLPRRRRRPPASSRPATPTSRCSSAPSPTRSAPRASRARACSPRPCCCASARCRLDALRAVVVNSGNANAATGNRGLEDAARMQGAAAMAAGVREDQVAVASTGVIGVPLPMDGMIEGDPRRARRAARPTATPRSGARSRPPTRSRSGSSLDVALPSGTVRLSAQAKGAGMIQPGFATMLCFVQTDAALAAGDRRPAARRLRQALVRPHLRRRPALHQRHRDPDGVGRERRDRRAGVRGRAALRRGARLRAAPARAADRARRRGRRARRARARPRRARARPSSASRARSPTRRWSRPR